MLGEDASSVDSDPANGEFCPIWGDKLEICCSGFAHCADSLLLLLAPDLKCGGHGIWDVGQGEAVGSEFEFGPKAEIGVESVLNA